MFNPNFRNQSTWPEHAIAIPTNIIPDVVQAQLYDKLIEFGNIEVLAFLRQHGFTTPTGDPDSWDPCEMAEFAVQAADNFPELWSLLLEKTEIPFKLCIIGRSF